MARPSLREQILSTAVAEFHRRGYGGCSVDTITKSAGAPKGSFYNHFASKEALGVEALARYAIESGWSDVDTEGLPPLAGLRARFQHLALLFETNEYSRGCLFGNMGAEQADHSPAIRAEVLRGLTDWWDSITDALRAAQAAGDLAADLNPERLGWFLLDAWEGALLRAKVTKNAEPLGDFFAVTFDQLLRPPAQPV